MSVYSGYISNPMPFSPFKVVLSPEDLLKVLQVLFTKLLPLPFPQLITSIKVKWK